MPGQYLKSLALAFPGLAPASVMRPPDWCRRRIEGLIQPVHAVENLDQSQAVGLGQRVFRVGGNSGEMFAQQAKVAIESRQGVAPLAERFGRAPIGFAILSGEGGQLFIKGIEVRRCIFSRLGCFGKFRQLFQPLLEIPAQNLFPVR